MFYKKIFLKDIDEKFSNTSATLRIYISDRNEAISLRAGMLVCPGGGYSFCAPREAEPVAFRFLSEGFNCFILDYTVNEKYPAPHLDLALAIAYIRSHEKEFDLIPNSLSIIGFSAGGHLVGSFGYLYKELAKDIGVNESTLRPFSITMAYPVITFQTNTHSATFRTIAGNDASLLEKADIIKHVDSNYPPTFLWTTLDDELVPAQNTIMMEEILKKYNVKHECKLFESGEHGSSLCNRSVYQKGKMPEKMKNIRDWPSLVADFIFNLF